MSNIIPSKSSPHPLLGEIVEDPQHPNQETTVQTASSPHTGLQLQSFGSADVVEERQKELHTRKPKPSHDGYDCGHKKNRDNVIKEITAFIGPQCQPKPEIDEELSKFYKELEEIDHQDTTDSDAVVNEGVFQPVPTLNPSPRNEIRGTDHKNAYRPYPLVSPQKGYGNCGQWRSQPRMTFNDQRQWHHPPPRPPHGPPRIQFQSPEHFWSPPPPGNLLHPPYLQPLLNDCSQTWERPHWQPGFDVGFSPTYSSKTSEWREGRSDNWQHYDEQRYHENNQQQQHNGTCLVLILMRGVPGSGKSTLAKEILSSGPNGLILSTDDYFFQEDGYFFDPSLLGHAHDWNQKRAKDAMLRGRSPVIIDNTNVQAWEMKPYVTLALELGYKVEFVEPDTKWKCDPAELEKRNKHGVPRETIAKMLDRFEIPVSVDVVLNSFEPAHKSKEHLSRKTWKENM